MVIHDPIVGVAGAAFARTIDGDAVATVPADPVVREDVVGGNLAAVRVLAQDSVLTTALHVIVVNQVER